MKCGQHDSVLGDRVKLFVRQRWQNVLTQTTSLLIVLKTIQVARVRSRMVWQLAAPRRRSTDQRLPARNNADCFIVSLDRPTTYSTNFTTAAAAAAVHRVLVGHTDIFSVMLVQIRTAVTAVNVLPCKIMNCERVVFKHHRSYLYFAPTEMHVEVLFSVASCVCLFVRLFVCLLAELHENGYNCRRQTFKIQWVWNHDVKFLGQNEPQSGVQTCREVLLSHAA